VDERGAGDSITDGGGGTLPALFGDMTFIDLRSPRFD
jgi:hypothetical protein